MTRNQLDILARSHGATLHDEGDRSIVLVAELPRGRHWCCNASHCITASSYPGKGAMAFVCGSIAKDMAYGVEDCWDDDCEYCWPTPDELTGTPYAACETAKSVYLKYAK